MPHRLWQYNITKDKLILGTVFVEDLHNLFDKTMKGNSYGQTNIPACIQI
jgi:hypothetical protein